MPHLADPLDVADQFVAGGQPALRVAAHADAGRVPVKMMSPGSSGSTADSREISCGTEISMWLVREFCTSAPLTEQASSRSSGLANSSGVTSHGPVGPNRGNDLPMLNCGGAPDSWVIRSEMSCPMVSPATCFQASASATLRARAPMTTTSSTSQSVRPCGGSTMSPNGPVMQLGNFVNTLGRSGAAKPDSVA